MDEETPDQMLVRISRTVEEMSRTMSELMHRRNVLDGHVTSLLAQSRVPGTPTGAQGATEFPAHPNGHTGDADPPERLKSTSVAGWKAIRYRKVYLDTIPEYDGKASSWSGFRTKLRLNLDQAYEWAPLYLRMSERLEAPPVREDLIAWIEKPEINYDRSDLIEFGKDLWCILCNRTASGTGPSTIMHRGMDAEVGWMRGPVALYEIQREALGRAADRRAELNRRVHNPTSVNRWEDVAGAINSWESLVNEYATLTGNQPEEETKMNSLMRLLPKSLYEISVTQYGIKDYAQLRSYVLAQCTRAKYGQHGLNSTSTGPAPMDLSWLPDSGDPASEEEEAAEAWTEPTYEEYHEEEYDQEGCINVMKGKGKKGKGKGKGKLGKDRGTSTCWWCNRPGHTITECYDLQNLKGKVGKSGGKGKGSGFGKTNRPGWTPAPTWNTNPAGENWVQPVVTDQSGSVPLFMLTCGHESSPLCQVHSESDDGWECLESMIDSGAARSVCPVTTCPENGLLPITSGPEKIVQHWRQDD